MTKPPLKILFIAGCGRSGTTLLARLLGQLNGFVSLGELTNLWEAILEHRPCSCGEPFRNCRFWSQVLEPDLLNQQHVREMMAARQRLLEQPIFRLRRPDLWGRDRRAFEEESNRYASILGQVYRRVQQVSGCEVVVDCSKQPPHGYAAGLVPDCEIFVLHLVRDPRAVAFSMERHEQQSWRGAAGSARYWISVNSRIEYLWGVRAGANFLRVLYENFAVDPRRTVAKVLQFLGADQALDIFVDGSTVHLHSLAHNGEGYPNRFPPGLLKIQLDDRWSTEMPLRDRLPILVRTWPLLLRYGYPVN